VETALKKAARAPAGRRPSACVVFKAAAGLREYAMSQEKVGLALRERDDLEAAVG
jgi:hypothetical protein